MLVIVTMCVVRNIFKNYKLIAKILALKPLENKQII